MPNKNVGWGDEGTPTEVNQAANIGVPASPQPTARSKRISKMAFPGTWISTQLGEVCDLMNGYAFKSKDYQPDGDFVIRIGNVQDGKIVLNSPAYIDSAKLGLKRFQLASGDLLMSLTGNVGRVGIIQECQLPAVLNQRVAKISPSINGTVSKRWVFYLLQSPEIKSSIYKTAKGAAQLNISGKDVLHQEISLPPLAEQKQIAAKLDELLAQVDTLKTRLDAIPAILKRFRQSVLAAAVSGQLTEEWREANTFQTQASITDITATWASIYDKKGRRYKAPVFGPLDNSLPPLPAKWQWTRIGYIFDVYVGATPSRKEPRFWGGNINWVSSSEVAFCRIKSTKETITPEGLEKASTMVHPPGSVMLAMIGQGKTRGQPAILDIHACHNQNTAALRVSTAYCVSEYLYYYLAERYEETRQVGSGNNQQAMNKKVVQSLPFPLPPKEEQTQIVHRVEQLFAFAEQIEQRVKAAQSRVNHLTQSILAKAFRGELTAEWREQHPYLISGEHSAEALLAHIKTERQSFSATKRTRKKRA